MKAIVRYGQAFGGYTMRDVPEPTLSLIHI